MNGRDRDRGEGDEGRDGDPFGLRRRGGRRKVCRFCADSSVEIDYKDAKGLRLFTTEIGKLIPQRISGNCAKHQRRLAVAVKRARHIAIMPFAGHGL